MATQAEFNKTLLKNFGTAKPNNGGEHLVFHGNVVVMLGHCLDSLAAGFAQRSWPELYDLMSANDSDEEFTEKVRQVHMTVGKVLALIDKVPKPDEQVPTTIHETLQEAGWESLDERAKVSWLSMLGLYFMSRVWVIGRQQFASKGKIRSISETIGLSVEQMMRMFDQDLSPTEDGLAAVRAAARYAYLCGLGPETIASAAQIAALSDSPAVKPIPMRDMRNIDVPEPKDQAC